MLIGSVADNTVVVYRALVTVSCTCCLLLVASFGLFARSQVAGASQRQVNALAVGPVSPTPVTPAHHVKGQPRRFIDGAASELTSPFDSLVSGSHSEWARHALLTLLGLLVYGAGIGYLARYSRGVAPHHHHHAAAGVSHR
jgi:hypothetical protein